MKKAFEFLPLVIVIFVLYAFANMANAAVQNRSTIKKKLEETRVPLTLSLNGLTMNEVIGLLPTVEGNDLNYFWFPPKKKPVQNTNVFAPNIMPLPAGIAPNPIPPQGVGMINPATGLPLPPPVPQQIMGLPVPPDETAPKIVGLQNKIRNINLRQLLDIISMSFDKPIKYVITDYGIIFVEDKQVSKDGVRIFSRTYRVNPSIIKNFNK